MSMKEELEDIADCVIDCVEVILGVIGFFIMVTCFFWVPYLAGLFFIYTPTIILEILLGLIILIVIASYVYVYVYKD